MSATKIILATCSIIAIRKLYQSRYSKSFFVRGKVLLLEVLTRAALYRFLFTPYLRLSRWITSFKTDGLQQPMNLNDFKDSVGRNWLTAIVKRKVSHVDVHQFAAGQTGLCARLEIQYDDNQMNNNDNAPTSLVVKMSRPDTIGKVMNMMARLYSECYVYMNTLQNIPGLPIPKCYFVDVDSLSYDFLLLLEDASNVDQGNGERLNVVNLRTFGEKFSIREKSERGRKQRAKDWNVPSSMTTHAAVTNIDKIPKVIEYMKQAASTIATLHAKYWKSEEVFDMDIHSASEDNVAKVFSFIKSDFEKTNSIIRQGKYEGTTPYRNATNIDEYETLVLETLNYPYMHIAAMKGYPKDQWEDCITIDDLHNYLRQVGFTLTHGDFHAENILIRNIDVPKGIKITKENELWILDWQVGQIADPVRDIAQLIGVGGLDNKTYGVHDEEIVKVWWNQFVSLKPGLSQEYPWELAWSRYKYHAGASIALLISVCNAIKGFTDGDLEDHTAGWLYRGLIDRFNTVIAKHGDPRKNYNDSIAILRKMGKDVGDWGI